MEWWEAALRLLVAVIVGSIIGIERERKNRPAGMRTHVLVCVGAAIIAILESYIVADTIALNANAASTGIAVSKGRMVAQVVSGIGFLGAGTIFVSHNKIAGLTTAASLWNAACIGLAAGMGYYGLAAGGCIAVFITLAVLQKIAHVNVIKRVEVKYLHRVETINYITAYFDSIGIRVLDVDFHVENKDAQNIYTNVYTLNLRGNATYCDIVNYLSEHPNIQGIRTRNT